MSADTYSDSLLNTGVARFVSGEDLQPGDFVSVLNEIHEFPSFLWGFGGETLAPEDPVRMLARARDSGTPLRVKAVCLPFVLVKSPRGKRFSLDLRKVQIVRLGQPFARQAWKSLRKRKARDSRRKPATNSG